MLINPNELLERQLATSFGLDQYSKIISQLPKVNVSADEDFQRTFNGFYKVRRNAEWRQKYYKLFEKNKYENYSFAEIITLIFKDTGNVEPSFSSKMYATFNVDKPIWDQYVLENTGFVLKGEKEKRIQNAITLYSQLEEWYDKFLETQNAKDCIIAFNQALPSYSWISSTKKIDCFLWGLR